MISGFVIVQQCFVLQVEHRSVSVLQGDGIYLGRGWVGRESGRGRGREGERVLELFYFPVVGGDG